MENETRSVLTDVQIDAGMFKIGARYHITTLSYQYTGTLVAVGPLNYMFENTATVFETGEFGPYFESGGKKAKLIEAHKGAKEMLVDRAGTVLHRFG